jgi:hypothetical protein
MKTQLIPTPKNWQELQPHPLSALVEFGAGIDVGALAKHMQEHGYDPDEAIIIHDGMILDGRHKHAATIQAGITPTFRLFVGTNAMAYVAKKLFRQHLSESQRAMMAATLAKVLLANSSTSEGGRPANLPDKPPSQSQIADTLNVSERSVRDAVKVQRSGTETLGQAVMDGTVSVSDAAKVATEPPEVQNAAVDAVRRGLANTASEASGINLSRKQPPARESGDDTESNRQARRHDRLNGQPAFSLKEFDRLIGRAGNEVDKLAEEFGLVHRSGRVRESPEHRAIGQQLDAIKREVKKWYEELKRRKQANQGC